MPKGQLCSQCHESGHNKSSPQCSVNIAIKQSEALAAISAARSNNLKSSDSRNINNHVQQFNPSPANKGEFNSIADTNLLNDSNCHPTTTPRPKSSSKNLSPRSAHSSYIEATPADDEFRRDVQDISDFRGIGAIAWGRHISGKEGKQDLGKISANQQDPGKPAPRSQRQDFSKPAPSQRAIVYNRIAQDVFGSTTTEDSPKHGPMQISSPRPQSVSNPLPEPRQEANYIEASAEDEVIMSEEAGRHCLVLFADSDIPVCLPVPGSEDEFQQGGA